MAVIKAAGSHAAGDNYRGGEKPYILFRHDWRPLIKHKAAVKGSAERMYGGMTLTWLSDASTSAQAYMNLSDLISGAD